MKRNKQRALPPASLFDMKRDLEAARILWEEARFRHQAQLDKDTEAGIIGLSPARMPLLVEVRAAAEMVRECSRALKVSSEV